MTLRTWTYYLDIRFQVLLILVWKMRLKECIFGSMKVCHIPKEHAHLVLRIVDEIREHYVTNFVDDRFDCSEQAMTARGKLHHTFPWDRCDYMCTCRDTHKYVYMCNLLYVQNHSIFTFCFVIIIYFPKGWIFHWRIFHWKLYTGNWKCN